MKKTSDDNENWVWVGCMCDKAFCGIAKPWHENWKSFHVDDCDDVNEQHQQWQQQRSVGSKTETTKHELMKIKSGEQNNDDILNYFENECGN